MPGLVPRVWGGIADVSSLCGLGDTGQMVPCKQLQLSLSQDVHRQNAEGVVVVAVSASQNWASKKGGLQDSMKGSPLVSVHGGEGHGGDGSALGAPGDLNSGAPAESDSCLQRRRGTGLQLGRLTAWGSRPLI